jgi:hypothetical protein
LPSWPGAVVLAHAHRDHRLELDRRLAPSREKKPQAARCHRQHDVVDRGSKLLLYLLEVRERPLRRGQVATGGTRLVKPGFRRRRLERAGDHASGLQALAGQPKQPPRMPGQPHQRGAQLDCLAEPVHHAVEQQTQAVGGAGGPPAVRPGLDRLRRGVKQQRRQLDRGEPVDHAVMDLADHPDAPVVQTVGDPQLPQRTAVD